ncbi:MAG: transcriptional regulator [Lachnospiraceae bacterium]|nr:transcriptional regulator [Lachnospiraceae bacterium]
MLQQLGVMLCSERERMGKKQKDIADGIISIAELSRVEAGEQEIDYFTLQALFERLGKSIDKLEIAVSNSEYESISYRIGIERSIESWDCEKLAKLLSRYYDCECNDSKRPIHRQYKMAMEAMCCYVQERDYAACMHKMEHALACTSQKDWRQKIRNKQHLCNQEIRIILVITYCQWKLGSTDGLTVRLEQLGRYILHHYTDMEEQVKVYPHCAWLLGRIYLEQNEIAEACAMCRKGKKVLIENGSLSPLWEILELEAACLERMDRQTELSRCRKYQESVLFLHKAAGVQFESNMMATFMRSSFQGEFVITNELVRNLREAQGLTQEKLCAEICSQETLSRIEKGKRKPNKKKLYQLLKKMGMERENYYGKAGGDRDEKKIIHAVLYVICGMILILILVVGVLFAESVHEKLSDNPLYRERLLDDEVELDLQRDDIQALDGEAEALLRLGEAGWELGRVDLRQKRGSEGTMEYKDVYLYYRHKDGIYKLENGRESVNRRVRMVKADGRWIVTEAFERNEEVFIGGKLNAAVLEEILGLVEEQMSLKYPEYDEYVISMQSDHVVVNDDLVFRVMGTETKYWLEEVTDDPKG